MGHVYRTRDGGAIEARESIENPSHDWVKGFLQWTGGGMDSATGRTVTHDDALRGVSAVYACVRVIAESFGQMPCFLYSDADGLRKQIPPIKGLARALHQVANPAMAASTFWETMVGIAALWGNSDALTVRNHAGEVVELWPLRPGIVEPVLTRDGKIIDHRDIRELRRGGVRRAFIVTIPGTGEKAVAFDHEILHVPALSTDGLKGISPIGVARQTIAAAQAAAEFHARFYDNDASPGGIISINRKLQDSDFKRYRSEWEKMHRGLDNRHRVAIMDSGVSWTSVGMPLADAQFVETNLQDVLSIARTFRVQPHKIGILDKATWGNIEHEGINFLTDTMGPWVNRVEGAANLGLGPAPKTLRDTGLIVEFLAEALLRMDAKTRAEIEQIRIRTGTTTRNEIRRRDNQEPLPGGDTPLVSADTVALDPSGVPIRPPTKTA